MNKERCDMVNYAIGQFIGFACAMKNHGEAPGALDDLYAITRPHESITEYDSYESAIKKMAAAAKFVHNYLEGK